MVDFKGAHYPKSVILFAVFFYLRYPVSYRDLEEIMEERGVDVDHATLNRWVVNYSPLIAAKAQAKKRPTAISWRMDETYIKVRGKCMYGIAKLFTRACEGLVGAGSRCHLGGVVDPECEGIGTGMAV